MKRMNTEVRMSVLGEAKQVPRTSFAPRWLFALLLLLSHGSLQAHEFLTLQLGGSHHIQFAGYYAALFKDFYREAGLDVRLQTGTSRKDAIQAVGAGEAQFGIADSSLLQFFTAGQQVVALAAFEQHSPLILVTRKQNSLSDVHELRGKPVILETDSLTLQAYLQLNDVHPTLLPWQSDALEQLARGDVAAVGMSLLDLPPDAGSPSSPLALFPVTNRQLDAYGATLFTSRTELQRHPQQVKAFVDATVRGWRYALAHPDEVLDWMELYLPGVADTQHLRAAFARLDELVRPELVEPGYMQRERWQQIADRYHDLSLLARSPDVSDFLFDPELLLEQQRRQDVDRTIMVVFFTILIALMLCGIFGGFYLRLRDESRDRLRLTRELAEREQHYRFVTEHSADVIWTMDVHTTRLTYISPAVTRLTGHNIDDIMSLPPESVMTAASAERLREHAAKALLAWHDGALNDTRQTFMLELYHQHGHSIPTESVTTLYCNEQGEPVSIIGVTRDITERVAAEEVMRRLAFYDPLTNLPNRRLLKQRLQESIEHPDTRQLALMFIDLDNFKPINDTLGHEMGDALLAMVAERMHKAVRDQDLVARLGGDEFVVLLPHTGDEALMIADRLQTVLNQPFSTRGQTMQISCSIGIALYPEHGQNTKMLMHHADLAMYQAKNDGRSQVCLYCEEIDPERGMLHWYPAQDSGDPQLDQQYHQIVTATNALLICLQDPQGTSGNWHGRLQTLLDATRHHFAYQEQQLNALGLGDLDTHSEEHRYLLQKGEILLGALADGHFDTERLRHFVMHDLIMHHVNLSDRRFFAQLRTQREAR
ncbi:PAS domain S-box-containing protein/diguanylate cyclase (GGDEF) domain-containing protein/hemerythrin-like metal-binding domain protein [Aeromonas sp. RU39B]|nr:PAS domain S-box-containing protein/diguanylate cyclase (GGDEF) domain-containing protein/hemerythrin-like metal-binding domain protein [Aeromonas sp. RU39B]